jgi:DNA-binding MarR family transcriptional regulator
MSGRETAELLLQVGRLVQAESYDGEFSPAQWMALRYFARANQFSSTPSGFAAFQVTTRGTASQAIKALQSGGYLVQRRSKVDRRSVSLRLTAKGKAALARDPFELLVRAVNSLDANAQTAMHCALQRVLAMVTASGPQRCFGTCPECQHLASAAAAEDRPHCRLLGVPIPAEDPALLCIHFQARSEPDDSKVMGPP